MRKQHNGLEEIKVKENEKKNKISNSILAFSKTEGGMDFLKELFKMSKPSGYLTSCLTTNAEIDPLKVVYCEGQRDMYAKIRGFIPVEVLIKIEMEK